MHRHHVAGLDDVVAVEQLAGARVTAHVDERIALVHDVGAPARQPVDHAVDGVLVARDQRRGEYDGVALLDVHEVVVALRDPAQRRQRLTLRAGGEQHHLLRWHVRGRLGLDEQTRWHVEVAEVARDAHVAHHGPAHVGHLAAVLCRGVHHLLDAVHVRGEAGDDDALLAGVEHAVQHRCDVLLRRREPRDLGVGRVRQEQVHTLLAQAGERAQVGDPAVERELVHLEVAGVQHHARAGADGDREGVRDRVVDRNELEVERTEGDPVTLGDDLLYDVLDPVLSQLRADQRQGQLRSHERDVGALAQQVGHRADVVLVAVGQHEGLDGVEPVPDRRRSRAGSGRRPGGSPRGRAPRSRRSSSRPSYSKTVMLRPTSPRPPSGVTRSPPRGRAGGADSSGWGWLN